MSSTVKIISLAVCLNLILATHAFAGPPFLTDDPEPVDYQHFSLLFSAGHSVAGDEHTLWDFGLYWTW
jgi:hypothetical protein